MDPLSNRMGADLLASDWSLWSSNLRDEYIHSSGQMRPRGRGQGVCPGCALSIRSPWIFFFPIFPKRLKAWLWSWVESEYVQRNVLALQVWNPKTLLVSKAPPMQTSSKLWDWWRKYTRESVARSSELGGQDIANWQKSRKPRRKDRAPAAGHPSASVCTESWYQRPDP